MPKYEVTALYGRHERSVLVDAVDGGRACIDAVIQRKLPTQFLGEAIYWSPDLYGARWPVVVETSGDEENGWNILLAWGDEDSACTLLLTAKSSSEPSP